MKLQSDPTVIYGMGTGFDGNLRRRDLEADTPYNTYTREGLPPTPIALPDLLAFLIAVAEIPAAAGRPACRRSGGRRGRQPAGSEPRRPAACRC
jgi:hypothetical protein